MRFETIVPSSVANSQGPEKYDFFTSISAKKSLNFWTDELITLTETPHCVFLDEIYKS